MSFCIQCCPSFTFLLQNWKKIFKKNWNVWHYNRIKTTYTFFFYIKKKKEQPQLFQSWKRKQSLAIFQTGWSLLGEAWAVKRKFWLKKRCLFPSNLTVPPVTTSKVVWPWVACSVNGQEFNEQNFSFSVFAASKH